MQLSRSSPKKNEKIRKTEEKCRSHEEMIEKVRNQIKDKEEKIAKYTSETTKAQFYFFGNLHEMKDVTLSCNDHILRINNSMTIEAKKGKLETASSQQLKEEKALVNQLENDLKNIMNQKKKRGASLARTGSALSRSQSSLSDSQNTEDEQLANFRALAKCSICHERQKDCVLTSCYHMFCRSCIEGNLQGRHRKCPGCNYPFGEGQVKSITL